MGSVTETPTRDRPYHHGNLRAALVAAGVELASENGPGAIALREAARRVGVSHNAGYRHFASREELVGAVAEHGMARLGVAMAEALAEVPAAGPGARLAAIGRAYVGFALAEPGLFRTAFAVLTFPPETASPPTPAPSGGPDPYALLSAVVDEFVTAGVMPAGSRAHSEVVAWSAVHGLAGLLLDGPLRMLPAAQLGVVLDRLCEVLADGFTVLPGRADRPGVTAPPGC